jgi:hypothetical protein
MSSALFMAGRTPAAITLKRSTFAKTSLFKINHIQPESRSKAVVSALKSAFIEISFVCMLLNARKEMSVFSMMSTSLTESFNPHQLASGSIHPHA